MSEIVGIDPGLSGAIALFDGKDLYAFDMPVLSYSVSGGKTRKEINIGKLAAYIRQAPNNRKAYMEAINGRSSQGGFTEFRFGESYGMAKAVLVLTGTPYELISPQKWKNYFGLKKTKGMTTPEFKTLSRELAMKLFPARADRFKRVKDDGRAEAALIALYGLEHSGLNINP
jgi:crossover junction endodeoxyribonuclease RuvC